MSVLVDAVEARRQLEDGRHPPISDGLADRPHGMQRALDVELGPRHGGPVVDGRARAPEVDTADHGADSRCGGGTPTRGDHLGRRPEARREANLAV